MSAGMTAIEIIDCEIRLVQWNVTVDDDKEGFIGTIAFLPVGGQQTLTHLGTAQRHASPKPYMATAYSSGTTKAVAR